jgi:hypothetical protein
VEFCGVNLEAVVIKTPFTLVMGYGQERGWRDFMSCRLKQLGFGFWQSSFLVGLIWGLCSCPAVLMGQYFPSNPYLGMIWMIVGRCLLSPIMQFFTEKANSKPIAATAAVMNGVLNTVLNPSLLLLDGGSELKCGLFGASGCITLLIANGLLYGYQIIEKKFREEYGLDANGDSLDTKVEKEKMSTSNDNLHETIQENA